MHKKIKSAIFVLVALCALLFTSCIDYVQTVSYKGGAYQMYYKITLSKVLFAMGGEDPSEIFGEFDEGAFSNLPKDAFVNRVDTDLEVGAEFSFSIKANTKDANEKAFLPTVAGNKCYIPFLLGQEDANFADAFASNDEESAAIAQAMLSSAKCRVLISKGMLSGIDSAYFEGRGGQNYSIALFDYGEAYCLEIPFIVMLQDMYRFDRIVAIKK